MPVYHIKTYDWYLTTLKMLYNHPCMGDFASTNVFVIGQTKRHYHRK